VEDTYKTIQSEAQGLYKDRGSKFLAFAIPVVNEKEIKDRIEKFRKKYHDARHICYAYRIGPKEFKFKVNDDGEPSGTAGKPILGQITANELTNILIIVVRYFGGILLGTSGLIKAYRSASIDCINNAKIIVKTTDYDFEISFNYEQLSPVMKIIKDEHVEIISKIIENRCIMTLRVRQSSYKKITDQMIKIDKLKFTVNSE
jgi:uncharacterized YigZ family protein